VLPPRSSKAGTVELGLTSTKPLPNWSPSPILIGQPSYSATQLPSASNSSSMIVTFTPFGSAQRVELERVTADRERLLVRRASDRPVDVCKEPPLGLVQVQTLGARSWGNPPCTSPRLLGSVQAAGG
jgi:hypothetical protein